MAEIITCPACQRKLQVPESFYGQTVQCPECRHQFVADPHAEGVSAAPLPAPPPLPPPASTETPRRRRRDLDDEHDDDDDDFEDMRPLRRSGVPHRGGLILAMGILALVLMPCSTIVCGPMAWIMGQSDLAEIRAGRMDPSGEGMVQAGRILGIISTILMLLIFGLYCLIFGAAFMGRH